ncbi:MAG: biotin/lipoyl-containing protein, partial [Parolsenella sp.]|uniref:acetyl-CoA carboxylase biotin carboxyl carrier protein n=1 Tax=Parolsenella sp. TaxID=2083006 RepID=UPI002E7AA317
PAAGAATVEAEVAASAAPEPAEAAPAGVEVTSPMVGVYYASPAPDAEPFVRVGSKVRKGETLCIIEAMKVMNEVAATADGEILSIEAADGDLVEYGSCLMRIG